MQVKIHITVKLYIIKLLLLNMNMCNFLASCESPNGSISFIYMVIYAALCLHFSIVRISLHPDILFTSQIIFTDCWRYGGDVNR